MEKIESIEEAEKRFIIVNDGILEYINKNFKDNNGLSSNVKNIKGLINFIKEKEYDFSEVDAEFLIDNSDSLKNSIEILNKNKELSNLLTGSDNENISNFFKRSLIYILKSKKFEENTNASRDIVHDYLKQIKFPLLSDEELKILCAKKDSGDENARQKIIESNLRLVVNIAKRYSDRGFPFMDIIGYGNLGLITAVDRFEINKGYKFSTYATYWIRQSIIRSIENFSREVRLPTYLHNELQKFKYVSRCFYNDNGRYPSEDELSILMDKKKEEIHKLFKLNQRMLYLDEPVGEDKETPLGDFIPDDTDIEEDNLVKEYYSEFMEAFNKSNLSEKEKNVLLLRTGYYDDNTRTLEEIGQMYGVTRERIRQIEAQGLRKLRHNRKIQGYKTI